MTPTPALDEIAVIAVGMILSVRVSDALSFGFVLPVIIIMNKLWDMNVNVTYYYDYAHGDKVL